MLTQETILTMSVQDIKNHYDPQGHFFDRDTMKFFGDTMKSFGVYTCEGERFLYRKKGGPHEWKVKISSCGEYIRLQQDEKNQIKGTHK